MGAVIVNPRRAPRAPVRCQAQLAVGGGALFASSTSDYGPRGCQLLAPSPLPAGIRVHLQLADEHVQRPVELEGRVAWVANVPPWRMGVAFEVESLSAANG